MSIFLKKYNKKIFLIGGYLRDKFLNLNVNEKDWLIIGIKFKLMLNFNFKLVGKNFPVFLHPINKEDCALARKSFYIKKYATNFYFKFAPSVKLFDDLISRDLTINTFVLSKCGLNSYFLTKLKDIK